MDGRFLLLLLVAKLASQNPLSPDTVKLYHDITSGKGLYSPYDKITLLNVTNFKSTLFNESNSRAWVVEFYNSWCGHCHRFAPIWKSLAADISGKANSNPV
ncbi:hypothetical protein AAG570_012199 [Ranatra chinensis]|uniref:Thioredoxin domain-containing protein n=1 Tax=Ranatra chinensis TaxID=642074 RepID=A0ABD0Z4F5_9HEMI